MMRWFNILLICILSFMVIAGFIFWLNPTPNDNNHEIAAITDSSAIEAMAGYSTGESLFTALLGISGLVYLKIIWKLIYLPNIANEYKKSSKF